jgi:hypothetical protein
MYSMNSAVREGQDESERLAGDTNRGDGGHAPGGQDEGQGVRPGMPGRLRFA